MKEIGRFPLRRNRYIGKPITVGETSSKITFSRENFKNNVQRVRNIGGKLREFGDKHPNMRDPSWMLEDDPFNTRRRKKRR